MDTASLQAFSELKTVPEQLHLLDQEIHVAISTFVNLEDDLRTQISLLDKLEKETFEAEKLAQIAKDKAAMVVSIKTITEANKHLAEKYVETLEQQRDQLDSFLLEPR